MLKREHYLQEIRSFYDSDLIKIITGIRRCGKSVILEQIKTELASKTKNIIYLNFEDHAVISKFTNSTALLNYIAHQKKDGRCYVLLDEIQNLPDWSDACKTLRLKDCSVFITGSNSKLLSREFTKKLSGRYVAFRVKPFVFKEIEAYAKLLHKEASISDYLIYGGFPQIFELPDKNAVRLYLNNLNDTIVINDIINRYQVRKTEIFKRLVNYVLISNSRIFSANSIHNYLRKEKLSCSINTIMKYLHYLEEAYIINCIKEYSVKAKRELAFYEKIYDEDVSFNSIRTLDGPYDLTHNLENIIYNELLFMGYTLFVYKNANHEIDFLAVKDNKKYLIQVAYSIAEPKAYAREMNAFNNLDNSMKKIIITNDDFDYSTSTVTHYNLRDFLHLENLA
jgi:predicted AAA+ superfamily ATPase